MTNTILQAANEAVSPTVMNKTLKNIKVSLSEGGIGIGVPIELLVEADGFTPLEAINIATQNGSIALGFEKTIGTIETGKSADLLIIDGDPSKNISDIRKILYVFKNGVGFNSKKLFESVKGKVGFN